MFIANIRGHLRYRSKIYEVHTEQWICQKFQSNLWQYKIVKFFRR